MEQPFIWVRVKPHPEGWGFTRTPLVKTPPRLRIVSMSLALALLPYTALRSVSSPLIAITCPIRRPLHGTRDGTRTRKLVERWILDYIVGETGIEPARQ